MSIEIIKAKVEAGQKLQEREYQSLILETEEIYEEAHEELRWTRAVTTVFKFENDDQLWAIDWQRGLTENCDHCFHDLPYKVILEKEDVVITRTNVIPLEE